MITIATINRARMGAAFLGVALLTGCRAAACPDGQQNPCKCGEMSGTQVCTDGAFGPCDCSLEQKQADDEMRRITKQIDALSDEQGQLERARDSARDALRDATDDAERAKAKAELDALEEILAEKTSAK